MDLSFQIGREQLKYGLGYSKRLSLSGDAPNMNFLKFNFKYGIINYSSIFASTVGEFSPVKRSEIYEIFYCKQDKACI